MSQPTEPAAPNGPSHPGQVPQGPGAPVPGPAPTQPLPPAQPTAPMPAAAAAQPPAGPPPGAPPPGMPGGPVPPGGPPPRGPGLWKQATSTTGGLIAVIVAACLAGLMVLGIVGGGIILATHVITRDHGEPGIERMRGGPVVPPGQRKKLEQGIPGNGKGGLGGLRGLDGGLKSLIQGAAGLGAVQHGEFTVQGADGKATVMTLQRGTVTKASSTSVTVKSADGFTATYAIDATTLGARAGTLAAGDTVMVIAQKAGAKAVVIRAIRTS